MRRILGPWDQNEVELIEYLRELELQNEVMWGLLTEDQKETTKIIMQDLKDDALMTDPALFDGLEEN